MNYKEYLTTDVWHKLRESRLEHDGYACVLCGSDKDLVVHHMHYPMKNKQRNDTTKNILTLCSKCHELTHGLTASDKKAVLYEEVENKPKMIQGMDGALYRYGAISCIIPDYSAGNLVFIISGVQTVAGHFGSSEQLKQELELIKNWSKNKSSLFKIGPNIEQFTLYSLKFNKYEKLQLATEKLNRIRQSEIYRKIQFRRVAPYLHEHHIDEFSSIEEFNKAAGTSYTRTDLVSSINRKTTKYYSELLEVTSLIDSLNEDLRGLDFEQFRRYEMYKSKGSEE